MHNKLKVALCQLKVTADKAANISNAISKIEFAAQQGAQLVVLPGKKNIYSY